MAMCPLRPMRYVTSNRRSAPHSNDVSRFCGAQALLVCKPPDPEESPESLNPESRQTMLLFASPPHSFPFHPSSSWSFLRCPLFLLSLPQACFKFCGVAECSRGHCPRGVDTSRGQWPCDEIAIAKPRPRKGEEREETMHQRGKACAEVARVCERTDAAGFRIQECRSFHRSRFYT